MAATAISWFVYVPVHEMLHAAGCGITGGEAREIEIAPLYGGRWLAQWIPRVRSGGDHAGRLSSFRTRGSDLRYLATDAAPYLLSILAVPLLRIATRRRRILIGAMALVPALAPFLGLAGDYYEMGSVLVTRAASPGAPAPEPGEEPPGLMRIRTDDPIALLGHIGSGSSGILDGFPGGLSGAAAAMALAALTGIVLAFATYGLGDLLGRWWVPAGAPAPR